MSSASSSSLIGGRTKRVGLLIRSAVAALGVLLVAVSSRGASHSSGAIGQSGEPGKPRVVVVNPPDCPLRISSIDSERLSAFHFTLGVVVVNAGTRPITAYAIRYSESGKCPVSGFVAHYMGVIGSSASNLGSGQSSEALLGGLDSSQAIESVEVAVDFVEFADRTTWGPDLRKNAQTLAGMRAGAREAQAYLKHVFQFAKDYGLVSALAAEHLPLELPKGSGPEWIRGFRLGSDNIKSRVKKAVENEGSEAAARVLNQPLEP